MFSVYLPHLRQVRLSATAAAAVVAVVAATAAVATAPAAAAEQKDKNDDNPEAAVTISTEHKRTFLRTFIKKFRNRIPCGGRFGALFFECASTSTHPGRLSHSMPCQQRP